MYVVYSIVITYIVNSGPLKMNEKNDRACLV